MGRFRQHGSSVIVAMLICLTQSVPSAGQKNLSGELHKLVDQEDEAFLLSEIRRIRPTAVLDWLVTFQQAQGVAEGGICGSPPHQFLEFDRAPLVSDEVSELEAAVALARLRQKNRCALLDLGFPLDFSSDAVPPPTPWPPTNMNLTIDWTVPAAFLIALEDGVVTTEEVTQIVDLPANIELLLYCNSHEEVCGHPVTEKDLAFHVSRAGSPDPLDRLWYWLNPMNQFGYADLVLNAYQYRQVLDELNQYEADITDAVLSRVALFFPPDTVVEETVALSVCCPMSNWATPRMVGVNIWHFKGDWEHVIRTITAAIYDQLQRRLFRLEAGPEPFRVDDLVSDRPVGSRQQSLEEAINTVVFEGTADYVADLGSSNEEERAVDLGAALLHRFATIDVSSESFLSTEIATLEEKEVQRSLCALGRHMTRVIIAYDGPLAMTALVKQGPAVFIVRAAEIESVHGRDLLSPKTISVIHELAGQS